MQSITEEAELNPTVIVFFFYTEAECKERQYDVDDWTNFDALYSAPHLQTIKEVPKKNNLQVTNVCFSPSPATVNWYVLLFVHQSKNECFH